jgi:hypothetical protein
LLLLGGEDIVSEDVGRMDDADGRLDDLLDGRLDGLRAAGRVVRDAPEPDRVLADVVLDAPPLLADVFLAVVDAAGLADRDDDRADVLLDLLAPERVVAERVVAERVVPERVVPDRVVPPERLVLRERVVPERAAVAEAALTVDMVFAAAVSAFAAVDIDFVAVLIARMAFDMVRAEAVALVAAAFILVAADVTFVAADDTVLAAVAGVVPLRDVVVRDVVRVERDAAAGREAVERDADDRELVPRERDVLERDVVPRDDRDALLRLADVLELLRGRAVVLRDALVLVPALAAGRLAAPPAALRLTDLLRAVPVVRRDPARVVV